MRCEKCGAEAHRDDSFARRCNPCERLTRQCICEEGGDIRLFKGTLPVYYEHGLTVNGQAEGVRKADGTVVITVTLLDNEDANRILAMLEGKIPLALSWALRLMEVKRAPIGGNDET